MKTNSILVLMLFALLVSDKIAAQGTRFFRISGPSAATITAFQPDGTMTWSNALPGTNYTVQTASSLNGGTGWVDYVQLPAFNHLCTNRLVSFNPPPGMTLIPAGAYTMGDGLDGETDAPPTNVLVSDFYMDVNLVSLGQWLPTYHWATNNGYGFSSFGSDGPNYPVQALWFDALKWCNARSQLAGLTPVYYTDGDLTRILTNGQTWYYVNWNANGYRLPTEAEWEKAARGGLSGQRFPWGNTISETQANYYGHPGGYDLGPGGWKGNTNTLLNGDPVSPYTTPLSFYSPNGYGLYDMAGNLFQWCSDQYGSYSGNIDPRGLGVEGIDGDSDGYPYATSIAQRGGQWDYNAYQSRTAYRTYAQVASPWATSAGFRCVTYSTLTNSWDNYSLYNPVNPNLQANFNPPGTMALVPAGAFNMGDNLDSESDAAPVTNVVVSAFYMDVNLVTYTRWATLYAWATNNGYSFTNAGSGEGANFPVENVDWYDAVKWCNARSQQAGLTPVYYTDAGFTQVFTTGETANIYANWSANGYRLPTEAEWEKAARGGTNGLRFPWGNTSDFTHANYRSVGPAEFQDYDLGSGYAPPGWGYDPAFLVFSYPYASPVGTFAPNGYGLYDMAGNMEEWCWDFYGTPYAGGTDPRGPSSGANRVTRGGSWEDSAEGARCAARNSFAPSTIGAYQLTPTFGFDKTLGFRCVKAN